jgi:hypothetical protein
VKRDLHYTQTGILDVTHLAFFTEKSLMRELTQAGLQIEKFKLMKQFLYTKEQNFLKYLLSLFLIKIIGSDSAYGQFGFLCKTATKAPL